MDKYYYVVAQLPMLFFDKETSLTSEAFLEEAGKWLSEGDFALLSNCRYDMLDTGMKKPGLLRHYIEGEILFRRELAMWRKMRKEGQDYKPESFPVSLVKEGNPLTIEKALLKRRWDSIETLETDHHFDLEFLILYFFKLQILEKLSLFDRQKGLELFQNLSKVDL